jgi:hypothetical protein
MMTNFIVSALAAFTALVLFHWVRAYLTRRRFAVKATPYTEDQDIAPDNDRQIVITIRAKGGDLTVSSLYLFPVTRWFLPEMDADPVPLVNLTQTIDDRAVPVRLPYSLSPSQRITATAEIPSGTASNTPLTSRRGYVQVLDDTRDIKGNSRSFILS